MNTKPKRFWGYANSRMKTKPTISSMTTTDGRKVHDSKSCAEILNHYFASVFTKTTNDPLPPYPDRPNLTTELNDFTFSPEIVVRAIVVRASRAV